MTSREEKLVKLFYMRMEEYTKEWKKAPIMNNLVYYKFVNDDWIGWLIRMCERHNLDMASVCNALLKSI